MSHVKRWGKNKLKGVPRGEPCHASLVMQIFFFGKFLITLHTYTHTHAHTHTHTHAHTNTHKHIPRTSYIHTYYILTYTKYKNGASGQVRSERRDAHVQAEIALSQGAAQNDEEEEQRKDAEQRKNEEAAAVAAEKRRMDAAAAVKSSFVATAFRLPGPKV
jgi:hypothetical protein